MISTTTTLPDIPDMPPFKPLSIPPPCPMQWQLSLDESQWISGDRNAIDTTPFHSKPQTPRIEVIKCRPPFTPTMLRCNEQTMSILTQFGAHNDYGSCYTALVNGYIRQLQSEISSIIPQDINQICATFYYEKEKRCIQIAYKLFQLMSDSGTGTGCAGDTRNHIVSGKWLVTKIETHLSNEVSPQTVDEVCNDLLKYGLLEVVSFETSFFSLFKEESEPLFQNSERYKYQLTVDNIKAFETFGSNP